MTVSHSPGAARFLEIPDIAEIALGAAQDVFYYWTRARGAAFAPACNLAFKLTDLPSADIPGITIVYVLPLGNPGLYRYRYWGTGHTSQKGYEMTGKTLTDAPSPAIWE
ncbi:MAG: hypothetical protein VW268_04370 [Rhodospirillaceae bacterium]